jgi:small-conductance mechanosensitive channel
MDELWSRIAPYFTLAKLLTLSRAVGLVILGYLLARGLSVALFRLSRRRLEAQQAALLRRGVSYLVFLLFLGFAFYELGLNLGVLLGAAGILSIAIGFASQTSASNLISGLFLIGERPFGIDDLIQVGGTTGQVLSIDLLSVKLRTFDNLYVRIPNETLIKSEVRTLTKFPIRRIDLKIGVAYKEDLERVHAVLLDVADRNPLCLEHPAPLFLLLGFGDSAVQIQFSPWTIRENYLHLKNSILHEIKQRFEAEGIEIPFPHRTLNAGNRSEPLPVRLVSPPEEKVE